MRFGTAPSVKKAKGGLHEGILVRSVLYKADKWGVGDHARRTLNVIDTMCLKARRGVTWMVGTRN